MKMKNLKTVLFIIIAAGLAAACKHRAAETERTPVAVAVMAIDTTGGGLTRTYVGEVEAKESIGLSFATGGKVEKVLVRPGDRVAAGQRLVTISKSTAQNAYNSAKASLDRAEDAYTRLKQVHDQGSLAEVKWVEMLTTLEQARAMEQIARKQLEDCALIAPASGVVGECRARAGASLLPGESAVTLLDIHYVTVNFSVPESEVATVKEGDEVHIVVPALDDLHLTGRICERGMNASRVSHSYIVKVELPNPENGLQSPHPRARQPGHCHPRQMRANPPGGAKRLGCPQRTGGAALRAGRRICGQRGARHPRTAGRRHAHHLRNGEALPQRQSRLHPTLTLSSHP